jgi:hypothetical protein
LIFSLKTIIKRKRIRIKIRKRKINMDSNLIIVNTNPLPKNRIINVEITNNLEGLEIRKFSLIKDNKIRLREDKIVNLEENSLIRTIGNTIIVFEKRAMVYSRLVIPLCN